MMPDREKVIKGLERCSSIDMCYMEISCYHPKYLECPYHEESECVKHLVNDALELLKEQEEIIHCKDCYYYHKPEFGFTFGDCTYRDAWYPVAENEFCSLAKRKEGR